MCDSLKICMLIFTHTASRGLGANLYLRHSECFCVHSHVPENGMSL